jgi:hypothetical protein
MTTFKPGDRVIVTIDGHDIPAEFMHSNDDGMSDLYFGPGVGWGQFGSECVRPVPMEEPTEIGSRVVTESHIKLIRYSKSNALPWISPTGIRRSWQIHRYNPRPYTGGDDD